jgi:sugar lactone lactonase YvrE
MLTVGDMKTLSLVFSSILLACSSSPETSDAGPDAAPDVATQDVSPDVTKDAAAPSLQTVITTNASAYELAEGLAVRNGKAYIGLVPTGTILEIDQKGTRTDYGHVPAGGNNGYTLGLAFDSQGALYALQTLNAADAGAPTPGVYKIPAGGGTTTTPFATDPAFAFPNGAAFDAKGNLLVTDSAAGRVFSVTPQGVVSTWKQDAELAGSTTCNAPLPFPIGANGIALTPTAAFVSNTANGSIVKIAIDGTGNAGAVSIVVKDCKWVGFDGIALDSDGTLLAAINGAPGKLARVDTSGNVTVLASASPLDGPASVAFADGWNGGRYALITNSAFFGPSEDGGTPAPGLISFGPL